jgi:hypothetical protein
MAGPFFQGSIQDLMNVAGPTQGGFVLGQMMHEQRRAQEAELQKSYLANMETEQKMRHMEQKQPFEMDVLKKKIEEFDAKNAQTKEQTRGITFDNNVNDVIGVDVKAKGVKADINKKEADLNKTYRDEFEKSVLPMEWSPNLRTSLYDFLTRFQLPQAQAAQIAAASVSQETWDAFRNNYFKGMPETRKIDLQKKHDFERAEMQKQMDLERARFIAKSKAAEGDALEKSKNFVEAATRYSHAEAVARAAGDTSLADQYLALANRAKQNAIEFENAKAAARAAGTPDGAAIGGLPTRPTPSAAPIPPSDNRTQAPGTVPQPTVEFVRDANGKLVRKQ